MVYRVLVKDGDGEEIELIKSDNPDFSEGAKLGAEALLNLFYDEMDLEDGYEVLLKREGEINHSKDKSKSFSEMFDDD